ncbi:MAG: hypothetical protein JXA67_22625 [Micromonosporaceae bacterium]|nr:hypothetical protein [Micromonosporaceae bacterium]
MTGGGGATSPPPETSLHLGRSAADVRNRIAAFVEEARASLPPDLDEGASGRTHGRWCDDQGVPREPLVSGRGGQEYRAAVTMLTELATKVGLPGRIDMAHHVEMKLAAQVCHARRRRVM